MNVAKLRVLTEELESIHVTNVLYWIAGEGPDRAARAQYKRRQDRLREIRSELYGHLVALASVISDSSRSCLSLTQRA
jgi:hypothetical protein